LQANSVKVSGGALLDHMPIPRRPRQKTRGILAIGTESKRSCEPPTRVKDDNVSASDQCPALSALSTHFAATNENLDSLFSISLDPQSALHANMLLY